MVRTYRYRSELVVMEAVAVIFTCPRDAESASLTVRSLRRAWGDQIHVRAIVEPGRLSIYDQLEADSVVAKDDKRRGNLNGKDFSRNQIRTFQRAAEDTGAGTLIKIDSDVIALRKTSRPAGLEGEAQGVNKRCAYGPAYALNTICLDLIDPDTAELTANHTAEDVILSTLFYHLRLPVKVHTMGRWLKEHCYAAPEPSGDAAFRDFGARRYTRGTNGPRLRAEAMRNFLEKGLVIDPSVRTASTRS